MFGFHKLKDVCVCVCENIKLDMFIRMDLVALVV